MDFYITFTLMYNSFLIMYVLWERKHFHIRHIRHNRNRPINWYVSNYCAINIIISITLTTNDIIRTLTFRDFLIHFALPFAILTFYIKIYQVLNFPFADKCDLGYSVLGWYKISSWRYNSSCDKFVYCIFRTIFLA